MPKNMEVRIVITREDQTVIDGVTYGKASVTPVLQQWRTNDAGVGEWVVVDIVSEEIPK